MRVIDHAPKRPVGAVAGFGAVAAIALAPQRVALVVLFTATMAALAVIGAAVFDLRRRIVRVGSRTDSVTGEIGELTAQVALLRRRISRIGRDSSGQPERLLYAANARSDDATRLAVINQLYLRSRYAPLALRDPQGPLRLENLRTAVSRRSEHPVTVSVIVPAHNAQDTIGIALRSLTEQTWANLQIIVVDDGSTDQTAKVVGGIADGDPRVELLPLPANSGAFAARNAGIARARGELVTVHDADDWSHAQMIEAQARALLDDDGLVGSISHGLRCREDLMVTTEPWNSELLKLMIVTLMVRRRVFAEIGTWDEEVRVSADGEFFGRLRAWYGRQAVARVAQAVPLTFALHRDSSLQNGSPTTGVATLHDALGARRMYRDAYQRWHSSDRFEADLPWFPGSGDRPFPHPRALARP